MASICLSTFIQGLAIGTHGMATRTEEQCIRHVGFGYSIDLPADNSLHREFSHLSAPSQNSSEDRGLWLLKQLRRPLVFDFPAFFRIDLRS